MALHKLLLPIFLLVSIIDLAIGQADLNPERFAFEPELAYNEDIQSPSEFLGYELGESFTLYANATAYFQHLAQSSDRVVMKSYGETYEGRKLYTVVISSPQNLATVSYTHLTLPTNREV